MAATKQEISEWFDRGVAEDKTHMIVVCDTFDYDDYPVYVSPDEDARKTYDENNNKNMKRVIEVYNLSMDKAVQMDSRRAFNF